MLIKAKKRKTPSPSKLSMHSQINEMQATTHGAPVNPAQAAGNINAQAIPADQPAPQVITQTIKEELSPEEKQNLIQQMQGELAQEKQALLNEFHEQIAQSRNEAELEIKSKIEEINQKNQELLNKEKQMQEILANEQKKLSDQVQAEWQKIKETEAQLKQQFEQALQAAQQQGYQEGKQRLDQVSDEFENVINSINTAKEGVIAEVEPIIISLALDIANKILQRESRLDDTLIKEQVKSSVKKVTVKGGLLEISLSPTDMAHEAELERILTKILDPEVRLSFEENPNVNPGSCIIETRGGQLDSSFSVQIESIKLAFEKYLGQEVELLETDNEDDLLLDQIPEEEKLLEAPSEEAVKQITQEEPLRDEPEAITEELEPITEEPEAIAEELEPIAEEPEAVIEELEPVSEEQEAITDELEPIPEEPEATTEDSEPIAEELEAITEELEPIAEEPEAITEELEPISEEPEAIVEELEPIAEEPEAIAEDLEPVSEEPEAIAEEEDIFTEEPDTLLSDTELEDSSNQLQKEESEESKEALIQENELDEDFFIKQDLSKQTIHTDIDLSEIDSELEDILSEVIEDKNETEEIEAADVAEKDLEQEEESVTEEIEEEIENNSDQENLHNNLEEITLSDLEELFVNDNEPKDELDNDLDFLLDQLEPSNADLAAIEENPLNDLDEIGSKDITAETLAEDETMDPIRDNTNANLDMDHPSEDELANIEDNMDDLILEMENQDIDELEAIVRSEQDDSDSVDLNFEEEPEEKEEAEFKLEIEDDEILGNFSEEAFDSEENSDDEEENISNSFTDTEPVNNPNEDEPEFESFDEGYGEEDEDDYGEGHDPRFPEY